MGGDPDFAALGLLDGLAGASRLRLLEWLHEERVWVEELEAAVADGRLALLPAGLALGAIGTLTSVEVAEQAGGTSTRSRRSAAACGADGRLALPPRMTSALLDVLQGDASRVARPPA